ncbi:MAG: nucleoside-diphosphate kinase [Candidatus Giovannonibacteria bacterium]|nr:MAG: nucleoside-diphosphate kinase [Candidatus Giovannonibacteria bacterium]
MQKPQEERTFVLIKPEGVMRGIVGEIVSRFEKRGLKIIALKMVWPSAEHVNKHYPSDEDWFSNVGARTKEFFKAKNVDVKEHFGTDENVAIGKQVKGWLAEHLTSGPVTAFIIEGMHAVTVVRKIVGHTYPVEALPGTIRGDFSIDTPSAANVEKRAIKNIVHASGNEEEAAHEIEHWFAPEEIHDYKRADENVMF